MNKAEAKRRVCACAAKIIDNDAHVNVWAFTDEDGNDLSEADQLRMEEALNDLTQELARRGKRK